MYILWTVADRAPQARVSFVEGKVPGLGLGFQRTVLPPGRVRPG